MKAESHILIRLLAIVLFCLNTLDSSGQDTIHWSKSSKISWNDFLGEPDSTSTFSAISSIGINYSLSYDSKGFKYQVTCVFDKKKSWKLNPSKELLAHEQGHFDIAKIFSLKLANLFSRYKFNINTIEEDFKAMHADIKKQRRKIDESYDRETDYSRNRRQQSKWMSEIKKQFLRQTW